LQVDLANATGEERRLTVVFYRAKKGKVGKIAAGEISNEKVGETRGRRAGGCWILMRLKANDI